MRKFKKIVDFYEVIKIYKVKIRIKNIFNINISKKMLTICNREDI